MPEHDGQNDVMAGRYTSQRRTPRRRSFRSATQRRRCDRTGADLCVGHPDDPFLQRLLPELPGAIAVDILAAFVQPSGVALIEPSILACLRDGAKIRILAGDYLGISSPVALRSLLALSGLCDPAWPATASCAVRVAEVARLSGRPTSFHPKAWCIQRPDRTVVWVGSSNLSRAALVSGVEWNLRATSLDRQPACAAYLPWPARLLSERQPCMIPPWRRHGRLRSGRGGSPSTRPS